MPGTGSSRRTITTVPDTSSRPVPTCSKGASRWSPTTDVPASGYSTHGVSLVRNPSWDPATDPLRPAYADRIELVPVPEGAGAAWVRAGRVDLLFDQLASPGEAQRARSSGRLATAPADTVLYADLNVAVPPFDDPHVRRAVATVIDREAVTKVLAAGEPSVPAYHMALDSQEEDLLVNYVPSWASASSSDAARLAAARAEMRLSRYDRNGDGRCDAPSCSGDLAFAPVYPLHPDFDVAARLVAEQLRPLGLRFDVKTVSILATPGYFDRVTRRHVAVRLLSGFIKDYPGAATFLSTLYGSQGSKGDRGRLQPDNAGRLPRAPAPLRLPGNTGPERGRSARRVSVAPLRERCPVLGRCRSLSHGGTGSRSADRHSRVHVGLRAPGHSVHGGSFRLATVAGARRHRDDDVGVVAMAIHPDGSSAT